MDANFSRPSTAGTKDNGQRRLDTHQDVNGPLWFFNGDRCERWNFVGGLCPGINDSRASLFETPEECERSCQEPGARNDRCGVPSRVACTPDRLRQPYFANMGASGMAERCLKSSVQNLAGHLCIAGKEPLHLFGGLQKNMRRQHPIMTKGCHRRHRPCGNEKRLCY
ncbi:hypothetical protein MRX96_034254 [Rhipicephalus microplus]